MEIFKIENMLTDITPRGRAEKIAKWAEQKHWHFVDELGQLYNCPGDQVKRRAELRERLYSDYCLSHGIEPVYLPDNSVEIMSCIASNLKFENSTAFREDNGKLFDTIRDLVNTIEMGPHQLYVVRQHLDNFPRVANAILKRLHEGNQLTAEDWEYISVRKKSSLVKETLSYNDEELFAAVLEHMRNHPYEPVKYSAVGAALQMADDPDRARVNNVLKKMSDPTQRTWTEIVAVYDKKDVRKEKPTYIWAPGRRKLDANPMDSKRIICNEITNFLAAHPDSGTMAIREHCRKAFLTISIPRVVAAMKDLENAGRIYYDQGTKNQRHYRLADELDDQLGELSIVPEKSVEVDEYDEEPYALPTW